MIINIESRNNVPACELFVEILRSTTTATGHLCLQRPVLFMLPGGPGGNHTVYDDIKEALSKYADLVLIDPRGCGLSSPSAVEHCTMQESIDDIEAVGLKLGIKKFILLGGSYGAMVSLSYAIKYPSSLDGLILVAGAPSGECFQTALETLRQIGTTEQIALTEKLFAGKMESVKEKERYYSLMQNIYLAKENSSSNNLPTLGKKLPYFLELSNYGHSTILPNFNVVKDLPTLNIPALLLAGEQDWINNVKYAYQMHELIPNSELVVFPKTGHFIWQGNEDTFFKKIGNFISRVVSE